MAYLFFTPSSPILAKGGGLGGGSSVFARRTETRQFLFVRLCEERSDAAICLITLMRIKNKQTKNKRSN